MRLCGLRVLLAESGINETGMTLRAQCAGSGCAVELIYVGRGADLGHALGTCHPDLAIVELSLLQPDAADQLQSLHSAHPAIPLILLADPADKEIAMKCLSSGATDFLLEGYMARSLLQATSRSRTARLRSDEPFEESWIRSPFPGREGWGRLLP